MANQSEDFIRYQFLTPEYLNSALAMMKRSFYLHETVCKALGIPEQPEAMSELEQLTVETAKDGLSIIAIDGSNDEVVGVSFNKLQVLEPTNSEKSFFEEFAESCKHNCSRKLIEIMVEIDSWCNIFERFQIDCLMEIMFLATLPEYRGRGIGKTLCELSIEAAKNLKKGINVKQPLDKTKPPKVQPAPKIVTSILTSSATQKIVKRLGFEMAAERSFEEFEYEGRSFAQFSGPETPTVTLQFKRL